MKIKRNNKTQDSQKFWQNAEKAQQNVETWPEWKQNVKLTKYSTISNKVKPKNGKIK